MSKYFQVNGVRPERVFVNGQEAMIVKEKNKTSGVLTPVYGKRFTLTINGNSVSVERLTSPNERANSGYLYNNNDIYYGDMIQVSHSDEVQEWYGASVISHGRVTARDSILKINGTVFNSNPAKKEVLSDTSIEQTYKTVRQWTTVFSGTTMDASTLALSTSQLSSAGNRFNYFGKLKDPNAYTRIYYSYSYVDRDIDNFLCITTWDKNYKLSSGRVIVSNNLQPIIIRPGIVGGDTVDSIKAQENIDSTNPDYETIQVEFKFILNGTSNTLYPSTYNNLIITNPRNYNIYQINFHIDKIEQFLPV